MIQRPSIGFRKRVRSPAKASRIPSAWRRIATAGKAGANGSKATRKRPPPSISLNLAALGDWFCYRSSRPWCPHSRPGDPVEGFLNYGPGPEDLEKLDDAGRKALEAKNLLGLQAAARDPLLRKLVTVHILATETGYSRTDESSSAQLDRLRPAGSR